MWCPAKGSAAAPAEELALVIHGVGQPHRHVDGEWNLARDVRRLLVVELEPPETLRIQLFQWQLPVLPMQGCVLRDRPMELLLVDASV